MLTALRHGGGHWAALWLCLSSYICQGRLGWEKKCQQVVTFVTFAKIQSVPFTETGSENMPPSLILEIKTTEKPVAAAKRFEARYKVGLLQ